MKKRGQNLDSFGNLILRRAAFGLGLCLTFSAIANVTTLTIPAASKGTSTHSGSAHFPVLRGGDTSYDAVLNYHTVDGTAVAGTDYTATSGRSLCQQGRRARPFSPLSRNPRAISRPSTAARSRRRRPGAGFAPAIFPWLTPKLSRRRRERRRQARSGRGELRRQHRLGAAQHHRAGRHHAELCRPADFATGNRAESVTVGDLNGDGKPDLVVANYNGNTVSVLLNTTRPAPPRRALPPNRTSPRAPARFPSRWAI